MAPGGYCSLFTLSLLIWLVAGLAYVVRSIRHGIAINRLNGRSSPYPRRTMRWFVPPVALLLTVVALVTRLPLRTGFGLSRGGLDRLAKSAASVRPGSTLPNQRIGLYWAESIEAFPGGVRFAVRGAGFLDRNGFAYPPSSPPLRMGEDYYRPINGQWYTWRESW
ncbi:MAG: hypothetical protein KA354_24330 [Phycisphaerae bacterium]|nr:hypothetical protein [Phycisphaerae bacterium]